MDRRESEMYHNAIFCDMGAVFLAGGCVSFRYMVHNPPKARLSKLKHRWLYL